MSLLAVRDLRFGYQDLPDLLSDLSLDFESGQMVALTGPSGRGKSTLLYLLGLMVTPREGQVVVDGLDTSHLPDHRRARLRASRYGFVFQDAALDHSRSIMDNIVEVSLYNDIEPGLARSRAEQLMEETGVDIPADRKPGQVSGGQAQRISLCRALVHAPDILLADEPTGNLDEASADGVIRILRKHADQGRLTIACTHDPKLASACDEVIPL